MRVFFALLYHAFAFSYDLVAGIVSVGRWNDWIRSVVPFIEGPRVLELGFGPGHLQRILLDLGLFAVGLDESRQMAALAKRRLVKFYSSGTTQLSTSIQGATQSGYTQIKLTRGAAQSLSFSTNTFNTIVATFPSEYIFEAQTLSEVKRCLLNGGRLIVLPAAWPKSRFLAWLYHVTGESPAALETINQKIKAIFVNAGFETALQPIELPSATLLIVMAEKKV